jgi:hypothetical protein
VITPPCPSFILGLSPLKVRSNCSASPPHPNAARLPSPELTPVRLEESDLEETVYGVVDNGEILQKYNSMWCKLTVYGAAARPKLTVVHFPANAALYRIDGVRILPSTEANNTAADIPYDTAWQGYFVRVRPPLDKYSTS